MLKSGQMLQQESYHNIVRRISEYTKIKTPKGIKEPPTVDGKPYIPGSSIKGAVRSRLEYKFYPRMVKGELVSYACYVVQEDVVSDVHDRHKRFWGVESTYARDGPCSIGDVEEGDVCIVCDLFGAPSLMSRIDFSDAVMIGTELESLIDIGIKAFRPGSSFDLFCSARNVNDTELGLLYLSLELFSGSPVIMGFRKYVNNPIVGRPYHDKYYFGLIKFSLEEVTLYDHNLIKQSISPQQSLTRARAALEQSEYHTYLDYQRGAIKL